MHSPILPELLCPAGDADALRAAIDNGADAVYLGYRAFGARASAVNFDDEALQQAVDYAHLHHARVYVTVNTLVRQQELEDVARALDAIDAAGADAVIVQDAGVAALVKREHPCLPLHASTQTAICDPYGARALQQLGYSRVVLARECTLKQISDVIATGIETEVFAHGALCTAVSGRCLMSSMAGGRSGNRGRCAQPCRQLFSLNGGKESPLLSLRDLCLLNDLPQLCAAGVRSLKLEGRLKSAEYVAVVADVYRKALDKIAMGTYHGDDPAAMEALLQIFNRGGFTRGHAMDAQDAQLVTPSRVSHDGLPMGKITSVKNGFATVQLTRDLHDGDSLQLRGRTDGDMRYSGRDVSAGDSASIRLRPGLIASPGMEVARLSDARQLESARNHAPSPIPVNMAARFAMGSAMQLSMSDGHCAVSVQGPVVESARSRATTADDARRQLEKLGGTPFRLNGDVQVMMDENAFLPVSALNALRRDAVEQLTAARIEAFTQSGRCNAPAPFAFPHRPACAAFGPDTLAVIFSDAAQARALHDAGANVLIYAPPTFTTEVLAQTLPTLPAGTWLRLPPQLTGLDAFLPVLHANRRHLGGLVAEGFGHFMLPVGLPMLAGAGVPVTNREGAAMFAKAGACGFTLWPEWSGAQQQAMLPLHLPALLKMYGRETLMLLNHCPERVRLGLDRDRAACAICRTPDEVCGSRDACITDRKGYRFPLTRTRFADGCEITVLNALPTDLRAHDNARRALGAGMLLHFTTEPAPQQLAITRTYAHLLRTGDAPEADFAATTGHWTRGAQ